MGHVGYKSGRGNLTQFFQIPRAVKGSVQFLLDKKNERNNQEEICAVLDLNQVRLCNFFVARVCPYSEIAAPLVAAVTIEKVSDQNVTIRMSWPPNE